MSSHFRSLLLLAWFTCQGGEVWANVPPKDASVAFAEPDFLSRTEGLVSLAILLFGILIAFFCWVLLKSGMAGPDQTVKIAALILIVTGTLLLVAAGYDSQQIAPALGLLGSIAGYLLGRADRGANEKQ